MIHRRRIGRLIGSVIFIAGLGIALRGYAEDSKGVRIDDLPKPIPQAMEKIKEVGNEVGKGISKVTGAAAEGMNKAIKGQRDKK